MMRPFFSYFGSKWRLSLRLPPPAHARIVEPFAGSAGYSTRYGADREVLLVDIDERICALWSYLIGASEREVLRLPLLRRGQTTRELRGICDEARDLIGFWISHGTNAPRVTPSAWMWEEGAASSYWGEAIRARTASQLQYIRRWRVVCGDYTEARVRGRATWMVDPPYQVLGAHYVHGADGIDFRALASWCRARRGQVLVTEAHGARWLPFRPLATMRGIRRVASEVVWSGVRR